MERAIELTVQLFREGEQIIALSSDLNLSSFGDTEEEALRSFAEAASLFLDECQRMGTLEDVLEEAGFTPRSSERGLIWCAPRPLATESLLIAVA